MHPISFPLKHCIQAKITKAERQQRQQAVQLKISWVTLVIGILHLGHTTEIGDLPKIIGAETKTVGDDWFTIIGLEFEGNNTGWAYPCWILYPCWGI